MKRFSAKVWTVHPGHPFDTNIEVLDPETKEGGTFFHTFTGDFGQLVTKTIVDALNNTYIPVPLTDFQKKLFESMGLKDDPIAAMKAIEISRQHFKALCEACFEPRDLAIDIALKAYSFFHEDKLLYPRWQFMHKELKEGMADIVKHIPKNAHPLTVHSFFTLKSNHFMYNGEAYAPEDLLVAAPNIQNVKKIIAVLEEI